MKILVFGAGGDVGSRIVHEAHHRGHQVMAVSRNMASLAMLPGGVSKATGDARDTDFVKSLAMDYDVVVSATRPKSGCEAELVDVALTMLEISRLAGKRVILVGGAATLVMEENGKTVIDDPNFPNAIRAIADACQAQYRACIESTGSTWTYLSPPCVLAPGIRTGHYRLGLDHVITGQEGNSHISLEDFAVALVDEVETPAHICRRFTVGY